MWIVFQKAFPANLLSPACKSNTSCTLRSLAKHEWQLQPNSKVPGTHELLKVPISSYLYHVSNEDIVLIHFHNLEIGTPGCMRMLNVKLTVKICYISS